MTAKTQQTSAAPYTAPEAPEAVLARARQELQRQRMLAEEARRTALEEAEKAFQHILNASSEELRQAVIAAAEEHGGKAILTENSLILFWSEGGNIEQAGWQCQLVPKKKGRSSRRGRTCLPWHRKPLPPPDSVHRPEFSPCRRN